jgi:hypothetical protein
MPICRNYLYVAVNSQCKNIDGRYEKNPLNMNGVKYVHCT